MASNNKCDLTIVIPVFNEGENIRVALDRIRDEVATPYNVIIVYDFDADTTVGPATAAIESGHPAVLLKNDLGRGVLNAIKVGLAKAKTSFVCVTMADLSDPPHVINDMVSKAKLENLDLVCASRYMRGGQQIGGPIVKRTLSRLAGLSLYYFTSLPTHDCTNSFKLYRKSFLQKIAIESEGGFELGMELTLKAHFHGFKVSEVPTTWSDRVAGTSNFQMKKWLPKYMRWYMFALKSQYIAKPEAKLV